MNNFELISRALSYNNSEINAVKNKTKQNEVFELDTDALSGLVFSGDTLLENTLEISTILSLFKTSNVQTIIEMINSRDKKVFVLKTTDTTFTFGNRDYMVLTCTPCLSKSYEFGTGRVMQWQFYCSNMLSTSTYLIELMISASQDEIGGGWINVEEVGLSSWINGHLSEKASRNHNHEEFTTLQENIDKVDNKLFVGTQEEYDAAYAEGKVAVGALVIILDEDINEDTATVSVLGQGVLGTLVLGKELK
jgi:hypothetical protein